MEDFHHVSIFSVSNPFDWSRPVKSKKAFAGREEQLSRIDNILGSLKDDLAINIALTGKRASGKTSMLNAIRDMCNALGGVAVNIDLDENLIVSTLDFWAEVFDGIITNGLPKGLWSEGEDENGEKSRFFQTWRRNVDYNQRSEDLQDQGLRFGDIYANAVSKGQMVNPRPKVIEKDLEFLIECLNNCDAPFVAVLIDEADLFTKNMGLIQQLRNIMQNLRSIIFVFAGTEDMFQTLDDVFSPIPRQFEKINITNFKNLSETRDCVYKPLETLGVRRHEIEQYLSYSLLREIHERTDGNPYHLKLLLHYIFNNFLDNKENEKNSFVIDTNILSRVFKNISKATKQENRDIIRKLNTCTDDELRAIGTLYKYNGLTIKEASDIRSDFYRPSEMVSRNHISHMIEQIKTVDHHEIFDIGGCVRFDEQSISFDTADSCRITFLGDHLDTLFLDYFLQEKLDIALPNKKQWASFEEALFSEFVNTVGEEVRELVTQHLGAPAPPIFIQAVHDNMSTAKYEKLRDNSLNTILSEIYSSLSNSEDLEKAYERAKDFGLISIIPFIVGYNACVIATVSGEFRSSKFHIKVFQPLDIPESEFENVDQLEESYKELEPRALLFSGEMDDPQIREPEAYGIYQEKVEWIQINRLFMAMLANLDINEKSQLVMDHVVRGEYNAALKLLTFTLSLRVDPIHANNLSFVYMLLDDYDKAREWLDAVLDDSPGLAIARYNRAYIHFKEGNLKKAEQVFRKLIKDHKSVNKDDRSMHCLKIVLADHEHSVERKPDWDLVFYPDIIAAANLCMSSISSIMNSPLAAKKFLNSAGEISKDDSATLRVAAWNAYREGKSVDAKNHIENLTAKSDLSKYMRIESVDDDLKVFSEHI